MCRDVSNADVRRICRPGPGLPRECKIQRRRVMPAGILSMVVSLALPFASGPAQEIVPVRAHELMFRPDFDIPAGILHGTWDFDEWPGVNHPVVYKSEFLYNSHSGDRIKIDYFQSIFDPDDHEGYLKSPEELAGHGFVNLALLLNDVRQTGNTLLGVFAHPDDEVLLSGGLLAFAAAHSWNVQVLLLTNGSDGSLGLSEEPSQMLGGYNCMGVLPDGSVRIVTDSAGLVKLDVIRAYSRHLGVQIEVLNVSLTMNGRKIAQFGEFPGCDFETSYGPSTLAGNALSEGIAEIVHRIRPTLILTHGSDGEYGSPLHKAANKIVGDFVRTMPAHERPKLFTCFPEYNYQDKITHFLDLDDNNGFARERKYRSLREITFLYHEGADYDKPWEPGNELMNGVFVKDYGYTPAEGRPPRYEFFQLQSPELSE